MKALLRPLFVCGLSIAIAATSLVGSSSVALGAGTKPAFTAFSVPSSVNQGDKPTVTGTFTDPDALDQHTVQVSWGDGSMDFYTLVIGDRSFSVQKSVGYPGVGTDLSMQITLSDGSFSVSRFPTISVANVAPSITSFSLSSTELDAGSAVTASGGFDDPGTADTHSVTVNWGDGSTNTTLSLARRVWAFTTGAHVFSTGGTFTVTATVVDNNGGSAVATATVTVHGANQAPSVVAFGVTPVNEGGSSTLSLTFSDADAADTHSVSVAWGDGSSTGPVSLDSTATTYSTSHVYADTGTYQVGLTLDDNAGHSVTAAASVPVTNVAPTVGSLTLTPASVVDHQTVTLSGDFVDPGTADAFSLTVDWGDRTTSTQSLAAGTRSFSATHAYDVAAAVTIKATVTDRDNDGDSSSTSLDVLPSNHAPADLALSTTNVVEGGSTTLAVFFSDAEATDTHSVAIDWGDTSADSVALVAGATTASATHTYLETGRYALGVTVTDSGRLSVAGDTTVVVGNVAPSVGGLELSPSAVTDHQAVTLQASFSDPGTADTFAVSIDWGDQTAASTQSLAAATRRFSASHEYAMANTYLVTATVTDRDGGTGSRSTSVVVSARNTGPTGLALRPNVSGSTVAVVGTFDDPDILDTHTITMSWGDRTTTWTLPAGAISFSSSHAYTSSGAYTVSATVSDPSGESTSASVQVVVTVSAESVSELLDQMSALVLSFDLDRNIERWLVHRIDELKASLSSGNTQVCADLKTLGKVSAYANRVLQTDQAAALRSLAAKLEAAAQCAGATVRPNEKKLPLVLAAKPPVVTPTSTDKDKSGKSEKSASSGNSVNAGNSDKPAASVGSSDLNKKDKPTTAERKTTKNSGDRD